VTAVGPDSSVVVGEEVFAFRAPGADASELVAPGDAIVLLRYFEAEGEVRQAISVLKKRGGHHERSIRAFSMDADGVHVGPQLRNFRGILTGVPVPAEPGESAPGR
jgi:hypothetical protein